MKKVFVAAALAVLALTLTGGVLKMVQANRVEAERVSKYDKYIRDWAAWLESSSELTEKLAEQVQSDWRLSISDCARGQILCVSGDWRYELRKRLMEYEKLWQAGKEVAGCASDIKALLPNPPEAYKAAYLTEIEICSVMDELYRMAADPTSVGTLQEYGAKVIAAEEKLRVSRRTLMTVLLATKTADSK